MKSRCFLGISVFLVLISIIVINAGAIPTANLYKPPVSSTAATPVHSINLSSGSPIDRSRQSGGDATPNSLNTPHFYSTPGNYTVIPVTAHSPVNTTPTKRDNIDVIKYSPPNANFDHANFNNSPEDPQHAPISHTVNTDYSICQVEVKALPISLLAFTLGWHSFIVYTDPYGEQTAFSAGPTYSIPISDEGFGDITYYTGPFPGSMNWPQPILNKTLLKGKDAYGKNICFLNQANRINNAHIKYWPTGPNCNTATHSVLYHCECSTNLSDMPPVYLIGWDHPLI